MSLKSRMLDLLFPSVCPLCGGSMERGTALCANCAGRFRLECGETCPECGLTAPFCHCGCGFLDVTKTLAAGEPMTVCTFYLSRARFGATDRITEQMLYLLKQNGAFTGFFAEELSEILRNRMQRSGENLSGWRITYPPRSSSRQKEFGFDHSEEVARRIGKRLGIPAETLFLRSERSEHVGEQKYLSAAERHRQAEGTLLPIREKIRPGGKYLLFDDIITTGATMEAAARSLYFCGASAVHPVAIAHSMRNEPAWENVGQTNHQIQKGEQP